MSRPFGDETQTFTQGRGSFIIIPFSSFLMEEGLNIPFFKNGIKTCVGYFNLNLFDWQTERIKFKRDKGGHKKYKEYKERSE